ncbi:MAG TPA: secretion protein HlyD [Gammaproteobacteria bacterium]|nr:secretion protein HlyD [Gammaproteobacteria bacterium]
MPWTKRILYLSVVVLAIVLIFFTINPNTKRDVVYETISASGRIEGRTTELTANSPGKVIELRRDEGESVRQGETLAILNDAAIRAKLDMAAQQLAALEKQLQAANTYLEILTDQVDLEIKQAKASVNVAEAKLQTARAAFTVAEKESQRVKKLEQQQYASEQMKDTAILQTEVRESSIREAEAAVLQTQAQLALAKLGRKRIDAKRAERDALSMQSAQAESSMRELKALIDDWNIQSPLNGTILTRSIELGEQVRPGMPLFTLMDLQRVTLKVFIPETQIGQLTLNQEAEVLIDAYPDRRFPARVKQIAQQAEFTPKNVETREERVKLVFAVELAILDNKDNLLKPGMPADALIVVQAPVNPL